MSDEVAIVSGIFEETGLGSFFSYNAFMPYNLGKDIVLLDGNESLELIVNSKDNSDIPEETIAKIKTYLDNTPEKPIVSSWNKTIPLFYAVVKVWQGGEYFTQLIFISFSLIILISLTSLIVYSRKKEFGTLLAIGFQWRKITAMICLEYLIICCFAVLLGYAVASVAISFVPETGIYIASKDMQSALMTDYLRLIIYTNNFLYVLLLFIITVLLSVLISISRIKKYSPVKLINNY
jgi:ABC-type lipoprotein release transport system permease subunit